MAQHSRSFSEYPEPHDSEFAACQEKQLQYELLLNTLFEFNSNLLAVFNAEHSLVRVSPFFFELTGYDPAQLTLEDRLLLIKPQDRDLVIDAYSQAWAGEMRMIEFTLIAKNGFEIVLSTTFVPMKTGETIQGVVFIAQDITERKRSEEQVRYLAYYDDLTGLPNRRLFRDRLIQALSQTENTSCAIVVMFLDIDRFKLINDSLGIDYGDMLLMQVAERLTRFLGLGDMVARMDGDEFMLFFTGEAGERLAKEKAEQILVAMEEPFNLQDHYLHITCSIGISICTEDGETAELLMKQADVALSKAKEQGKNNCQIYASTMNIRSVERLNMDVELRRALQQEEFVLYYQPQIHLGTGEIIGAEALIRWNHPVQGLLLPGKFIPLAEDNGLISPIGDWVIAEACRQNKAWQEAGLPCIPISVNLSVRQFMQQNLIDKIRETMQRTGLAPQYLDLEITETMTMDTEYAMSIMEELQGLGVRISIDDFGTGYSSLNYLKKYPIHKLKIDRSFVRDILDDTNDRAIVSTIIAMAHNLNLSVIAEGVELQEQLEFLREQECDEIQGYVFSPPVPAAILEELLLKQRQAAASKTDRSS